MADDWLTGFECDKSLSTDRNLEIIRRKFPTHCPFHIAHNILGGIFSAHDACTVAPFGGGDCAHGSHADPARTAEAKKCHKSQLAFGKTLQLQLGFSRRAGSSKLHDGCILCQELEFGIACTSCGRAWARSRRRGARPAAADDAAWAAMCRMELQQQGGGDGGEKYGEEDGEEEEEYGNWSYAYGHESCAYDGREGGGAEDWEDKEEYGPGEEEGEKSSESSSGAEEGPPLKQARVQAPAAGPSGTAAPPADTTTLELRLELSQSHVRRLELELKIAKKELEEALKRLE